MQLLIRLKWSKNMLNKRNNLIHQLKVLTFSLKVFFFIPYNFNFIVPTKLTLLFTQVLQKIKVNYSYIRLKEG